MHMFLFRSALKNSDPVVRFLCLYNIILLKNGDSQNAVDAYIVRRNPNVAQSQSPMKSHVRESVYTRLRNEFAHIRNGASFDATRKEMEQNMDGLTKLAQAACLLP